MKEWAAELTRRIELGEARVVVVGLGYVGLPLALRAIEAGFEVTGIEIDPERVETLKAGSSFLEDVTDDELAAANASERWKIAGDFEPVKDADIVVVCVPTPLRAGIPDLSMVLEASDRIAEKLTSETLVSLESTTYPGTTEEVVRPRLEARGLVAGDDFSLAFSPERIDPGNRQFRLSDIPKIVGGLTGQCGELARGFYEKIVDKVIVVTRPREAELAKLLENTYRQVNIALINEFAMVAYELDIDIWEVIEAAASKPFGFQAFYPGVGIGGHCIAVDPVYLTWRIRELGRAPFRLVELAREVDESMPTYVARRIVDALVTSGVPADGAKVLVIGVTYKPDVADMRQSRPAEVIERLRENGCEVAFHDPFHESIMVHDHTLTRVDLDEGLGEADIVAILTHHSTYDWNDVVAKARLVFDTRGVTLGIDDERVIRL